MLHSLLKPALAVFGLFSLVNAAGLINVRQIPSLQRSDYRNVPRTLRDPQNRDTGLYERQQTCGIGRHECDTGGCCSGPCCGNGCCPLGYSCHIVGDVPGCCPPGRTCTDEISGCTSTSLVECQGFNHCCPAGEECGLDAAGNAQCGGQPAPGGGGGGNGNGNGNGDNNPSPSISDPEPGPSDTTSEDVVSTPTQGTPEIESSSPAPTTRTTKSRNASPTTTTRAPNSSPGTIASSGAFSLAVNSLSVAGMMGMAAVLML